MTSESPNRGAWLVRGGAVAYALALIALTLLPLGSYPYPPHNPNPFATIGDVIGREGIDASVARVIIGNILAFVPLGILAPLLLGPRASWLFVFAVALAASVAIELTQLAISLWVGYTYRQADVDDVMLNVAGAALGYAAVLLARRVAQSLDAFQRG